jgi:hypothetical protein
VSTLRGRANGTFRRRVAHPLDPGAVDVAVGGFNRDKRPDLAVANDNLGVVSILLND